MQEDAEEVGADTSVIGPSAEQGTGDQEWDIPAQLDTGLQEVQSSDDETRCRETANLLTFIEWSVRSWAEILGLEVGQVTFRHLVRWRGERKWMHSIIAVDVSVTPGQWITDPEESPDFTLGSILHPLGRDIAE